MDTNGVPHKELVEIAKQFHKTDRVVLHSRYIDIEKLARIKRYYLNETYLSKLTSFIYTMNVNPVLRYIIMGHKDPDKMRLIEHEGLEIRRPKTSKIFSTYKTGTRSEHNLPAPDPRWTRAVQVALNIPTIDKSVLEEEEQDFLRGVNRPICLTLSRLSSIGPTAGTFMPGEGLWLTINVPTWTVFKELKKAVQSIEGVKVQ